MYICIDGSPSRSLGCCSDDFTSLRVVHTSAEMSSGCYHLPGQGVFVDCTSGSDSTGDGSNGNPYLTIAYAVSATPLVNRYVTIVISNGPCPEPQIAATLGYAYKGSDPTNRVQVTNGFSYTSTGSDWADIVFSNFELPALSIDMTLTNSVTYQPRFFNCKITNGTLTGVTAGYFVLATFYSSYVELSSITGFPSFHDCSFVRCDTIAASSSVVTKGGYLAINPVMGDGSSFRMNGGDNSAAAFQCSGTGLNQPVLYYGNSGSAPSQTGCALVQEDDTYDIYTEHGSATIGVSGTIAVGTTEIYGYFDILVTPTSDFLLSSWWIPPASITPTGFVLHGPAGGTFRWRIVKG